MIIEFCFHAFEYVFVYIFNPYSKLSSNFVFKITLWVVVVVIITVLGPTWILSRPSSLYEHTIYRALLSRDHGENTSLRWEGKTYHQTMNHYVEVTLGECIIIKCTENYLKAKIWIKLKIECYEKIKSIIRYWF